MCDIPIEIADQEKIVRAVMSGHLNKDGTRLKPRAFQSRRGADEVSVIRHSYKDSDFCKAKGREVAAQSGVQQYAGLAVLTAAQIKDAGSEVHDSREEYCGHAHISHGCVQPPPNEPLPAREALELEKKLAKLRDSAAYYPDPSPEVVGWSGPEI
jgi:hypothetical protein